MTKGVSREQLKLITINAERYHGMELIVVVEYRKKFCR